ncbi:MAG TPA: peptidase S8, partial [Candidatus Kerfeldbacteria bacterium]|nr:peptidase S8 [Candidatus Kerfeldbacteria bacterium]
PEVRVFDQDFTQTASFTALNGSFDGGMDVAVGDVDGDGDDEIVVAAGRSGGPMVQVFQGDGTLIAQWFAYAETLRTGVKVAVGDLNGDGKAE